MEARCSLVSSVTDKTIMDRFRPGWVYDTTDQEPEQSDTLEGLAEKLGLDPKELKKTVDEFNGALVGNDCACKMIVDKC